MYKPTSTNLTRNEVLLAELLPYFHPEASLLHHPLIIAGRLNSADAEGLNRRYREKKIAARKAFSDQNWKDYIFLHENPYRAEALMRCARSGLTGDAYWKIVREVWITSENVRQHLSIWKRLWGREISGTHRTMHKREQSLLTTMPTTIPVWRGTSFRTSIRGLSWTFNAAKAEWFARRFHRGGYNHL